MADSEIRKDDVILEHEDIREPTSSHAQKPISALHHDIVAPEAIGGLYGEMPKGYYWSKGFLGTLTVTDYS